MKIFIFRHCLLIAGLAKTTAHRVLFLVSMDSQRSKKFDGSHFWALVCLQTASGWLESIRAIMAPPPLSNVIPEPAQNRVKGYILILSYSPESSCIVGLTFHSKETFPKKPSIRYDPSFSKSFDPSSPLVAYFRTNYYPLIFIFSIISREASFMDSS